jgi:hypothetical protein
MRGRIRFLEGGNVTVAVTITCETRELGTQVPANQEVKVHCVVQEEWSPVVQHVVIGGAFDWLR